MTVNPGLRDQISKLSVSFSRKDYNAEAHPRLTWSVNSCPKKEPPRNIMQSICDSERGLGRFDGKECEAEGI